MSHRIIDLQNGFQSPAGQYLLDWERRQMDDVVADMFGFHALQLGLPALQALQANRMPHRWLALQEPAKIGLSELKNVDLYCDFASLPFAANSLDLIVLPHTLELTYDPQTTLREVERVLVPEGKVVISSLNPTSFLGFFAQRNGFLPPQSQLIGYWRLRDWLRLLGFEVEVGRFGCFRPAVHSATWLERWRWMDTVGARFWPILGGVYFVVAVKRVRGMRILGHRWKSTPALAAKPVLVARKG